MAAAVVFQSSLQMVHNRNSRSLLMVKNSCTYDNNNNNRGKKEEEGKLRLEIGSPIIVVESPKMLKTAASVPCLRVNSGLVNPGDVGRIVSRKPKDVWAIRLAIGTYLIDAKYFKPLDLHD